MPARTVNIRGRSWRVFPSGKVTQYDRDEFALLFVTEKDGKREVRVTRYSPVGARSRERAFAEMSEADLSRLFDLSQPGDTSPEADYTS
ncbi:MAG TPA: hypothetical protein VJ867_12615 [Gemmatimonadaceae bacterium]|nr:hypothetical protein [Gemmatimonadaceae bacterium]